MDVGSSLPTYLLICDCFFLEIIVIVKSCLNVHKIILSTDELVVQIMQVSRDDLLGVNC